MSFCDLAPSYLYEVSTNLPPSSSLSLENKRPLARDTFDSSLSSKETSNLNFFFFILPTMFERIKLPLASSCHNLVLQNHVHISQATLRAQTPEPEVIKTNGLRAYSANIYSSIYPKSLFLNVPFLIHPDIQQA